MRELLGLVGFTCVEVTRHMEVQLDGQVVPSLTRWNYTVGKALVFMVLFIVGGLPELA